MNACLEGGETMEKVVVRRDEEIDRLLNACAEAEDTGVSSFPGMTYEQGVRVAINWLLDLTLLDPLAP